MQTPSLDNDAVLWSGSADEKPLIVFLHGYGADERDLFSLRDHLPDAYAYAAVRAPLVPPFPMSGYSWYSIDGLSSRDPAAVTAGATRFIEWLETTGAGRVGLIGFSQGGAIALQAMRLAPERFDFVVNLSGYAAGGSLDGDEALMLSQPPVFWGRGSADEVIPADAILQTTEWLPAHSSLVGRVYPGLAHAVSPQEIDDVARFLQKQLT
ncbi:MAG TPA: alpha/beta fold hydrolase [Candidatus Microbacterium stercoravium]|uniref:Alpha/beta fold hydrolase n=1 Tax=Candidatus Microbacterium stercoravium TaxID=2838697 RepID=A0A9D2KGE1_9MICO|nr:alpha/beta fold hydrolase [Candidatus Microbacterium stercoravium]